MEKSAHSLCLADGHVDLLYEMRGKHPQVPFDRLSDCVVTPEKLEAGDVRVFASAFYCPDAYNGAQTAAPFLEALFRYADSFLPGLTHVRSRATLEDCIGGKSGPGAVWLLENADALLEFDLDRLEEAGMKIVGLTHAGKNRIADGNNVPFPGGLTSEGRGLVRKLTAAGFAFDAAHLAEPAFQELVRISEAPVISSHTGLRALCDIPRNLSREQVRIILEREGIIGISVNPEMLSLDGRATIEHVFRHIDFIAQAHDVDGVALGSDFCGFDEAIPGLEDISKLKDLAQVLSERGYPQESIDKIMGKNWAGFYAKVLGP